MLEFIPSPSQGVWHLGPIPLRAYAFCIIAGALVAVWIADRRYRKNGGESGLIGDLAFYAIPAGIVGARLWHVATDWQLYFGAGGDPLDAFLIWKGGLGIWGGIAGGSLAAAWVLRRRGIAIGPVAGALAPALLIAQAIGRFGNYFNQELFGRPSTLPWALDIDFAHRPVGYEQFATFHPTFLYEAGWNVMMAGVLLWVERRFGIRNMSLFWLYVLLYTVGRTWIEALRIDEVNHIGPFRFNELTSLVVLAVALFFFVRSLRSAISRPQPGEEAPV